MKFGVKLTTSKLISSHHHHLVIKTNTTPSKPNLSIVFGQVAGIKFVVSSVSSSKSNNNHNSNNKRTAFNVPSPTIKIRDKRK